MKRAHEFRAIEHDAPIYAHLPMDSDQQHRSRFLRAEPAHAHVDDERLDAWAAAAHAAGIRLAEDRLVGRRGPAVADMLAHLDVTLSEGPGGFGPGAWTLAQCRPQQRRVHIFSDAIEALGRLVERAGWTSLFDPARLREVVVTHELAHILADRAVLRGLRMAVGHRVFTVGRLAIFGHVVGATEVMAHGFAQQACALARTPLLLNALIGMATPVQNNAAGVGA